MDLADLLDMMPHDRTMLRITIPGPKKNYEKSNMLSETKNLAFANGPPEDSEFKRVKVNNQLKIEKSLEIGPPVEYLKSLSRH
jgi:hypothetical protein